MQINIIYVSDPIDFTYCGTLRNLRAGVFAILNDDIKYITAELDTSYEDAVALGEAYFIKKAAKTNG